jgi:hypothetical protein
LGAIANYDGTVVLATRLRGTSTYPLILDAFTISGTTVTSYVAIDTNSASSASSPYPQVVEGPNEHYSFYMLWGSVNMSGFGSLAHSSGFYFGLPELSANDPPKRGTTFTNGQPVLKPVSRSEGVYVMACSGPRHGTGTYCRTIWLVRKVAADDPDMGSFDYGQAYQLSHSTIAFDHFGSDTLSSGIVIVSGATDDAANPSKVIALKRRNTIIGVAADAIGTVALSGTLVTTGLTPGARYYADDNGDLTAAPGEVEIGIASSATRLLLSIKPGI